MTFRGRKVTEKEASWLSVVHTMLVESLTVPLTENGPKTYNRLREVMAQAKFLSHPKKMKACEFGCAIQLVSLGQTSDVGEVKQILQAGC